MSDETRDRETILRERTAYVNGMIRGSAREFIRVSECEEAAKAAFPFPPRKEPRVVTDASGVRWSFRAGYLRVDAGTANEWRIHTNSGMHIDIARGRLIAELAANPWVEVPSDE